MTYPLSSDVTDGQPTAYQHYNNLRADALRFGQAAADAVSLGAGLARYVDVLVLEPLATNRLRVPYNAVQPCTLMIDGYLCQAAAHVDLASSTFSGAAATWYIFACRAAGSTTFTLSANTSLTEAAGQRRLAAIYWDGAALNYAMLYVYGGQPSIYYARVSRAAVQSINDTTWTSISFDTENEDNDTIWAAGAPTRLTVVHPGFYLVTATAAFAYSAFGAERALRVLLNGGIAGGAPFYANGTTAPQATVSLLRYLAAGDYLEAQVYQNSGGALNTATPTTLTAASLAA